MANNIFTSQIILDGDMSTSLTSSPIQTKYQDNIGIQLNWSGSPTGTFNIQISSDYEQSPLGGVTNPGNWIDVPLNNAIQASGSADDAYITLSEIPSPWFRVQYLSSSGSGALNAFTTAKGI